MVRLTRRINGKVSYAPLKKGECIDIVDLCDVWGERLADYEDAEEQGLLVRLPCRVGDAAFVLKVENEDGGEERIFEGEVISFSLADGQVYATIGNMEYDCWFFEVARRLSDIGVDWFLTREEAEKALEGANR